MPEEMKSDHQMILEVYSFLERKNCTCQRRLRVGIRDGVEITGTVCQFHNIREFIGPDGIVEGSMIPVDKVLP